MNLYIHGTPFDHGRTTCRIGLSAVCAGLGLFLWPMREGTFWDLNTPDAQIGTWLIAMLPWLFAAILPYKKLAFLNLTGGSIVTEHYYAWIAMSTNTRPLSDFCAIALRHVCHKDSEGPDTFTGSVGLKPNDDQQVLWLKEFKTTSDDIPREALEYAHTLNMALHLPIRIFGCNLNDLEQLRQRIGFEGKDLTTDVQPTTRYEV